MLPQVKLGRTNLPVSAIGLGGLFTSSLGPGFEESRAAVRTAVELGITYIDTAPAYANSEEVLGRILRDIHAPLVISTKLGGRPQPFQPQDARQLRASAEESLRLLGREVIDVLFVHEPDRPLQYNWWSDPKSVDGPVVEVLEDLQRRGVVRHTGLGGTTSTEMAHLMRSGRFDVVLTAFNYSALFREAEREVLPEARRSNLGVVLGSVLQQGALGRRYDDVLQATPRPAWLSEDRRRQLKAFYALLDEAGMPIAEFCLRFALSRPDVTGSACVLIGAKTPSQVEESVRSAAKGPLPDDLLLRADEIAAMVVNRPFEEPMILPLNRPWDYWGPGPANIGAGAPVGRL
ncbi:MAG: aldo/keto reductase [Planctomyces sp.]|nr:aldo/keto reductase [Planctomyces sp.]